jgi:hypothetical protein
MNLCKCEKEEWLGVTFGLILFMVMLFVVKDKAILLFEQMEWYRALAINLGGIAVIGSIAVISSFAAIWFSEHIIFVTITASILWVIRYTVL